MSKAPEIVERMIKEGQANGIDEVLKADLV